MGTTNIVDFARRDEMTDALTEFLKTGAQQLIATAVEAELVIYLAQFTSLRTDVGHATVSLFVLTFKDYYQFYKLVHCIIQKYCLSYFLKNCEKAPLNVYKKCWAN